MPSPRDTPAATVRLATEDDCGEVATLLTRAFANDPAMNWWGGVEKETAVTNLNKLDAGMKKTMENLHRFQSCVVHATMNAGGIITLALVPKSDGEPGEQIVAVALWMTPGKTFDLPFTTLIKSGAFSRFFVNFTPHVEESLHKSFKSRNLDRLDSWHLLEMVVDPDWEGKGFCSLLMKDGYSRASPKPIHLEATTPKSKDIYLHYGFEIDSEHVFGKGQVDKAGHAAKGAEATGYPEWVMTKWEI
ncbi:uncharacterized protein EV420DRAFT_1663136 [Desarmillaria tabescens]|uniref:N-acetyltransferase domain-containing protein n=1 Tax=Armillaria tabescens TaxID=1929756 RepID=A0AA39TTY6_ARMTA|nr:uncharacterized protein EV420DRAFT_1663136 [Desarmillaria tabescens]KAK0470082.1 hypothetical protein EV420DRAFT_1663136 [Desarmillaria tabescens]